MKKLAVHFNFWQLDTFVGLGRLKQIYVQFIHPFQYFFSPWLWSVNSFLHTSYLNQGTNLSLATAPSGILSDLFSLFQYSWSFFSKCYRKKSKAVTCWFHVWPKRVIISFIIFFELHRAPQKNEFLQHHFTMGKVPNRGTFSLPSSLNDIVGQNSSQKDTLFPVILTLLEIQTGQIVHSSTR